MLNCECIPETKSLGMDSRFLSSWLFELRMDRSWTKSQTLQTLSSGFTSLRRSNCLLLLWLAHGTILCIFHFLISEKYIQCIFHFLICVCFSTWSLFMASALVQCFDWALGGRFSGTRQLMLEITELASSKWEYLHAAAGHTAEPSPATLGSGLPCYHVALYQSPLQNSLFS